MWTFILYLLKANLVLVLFYLGYRLWLRQLTFYRYNRLYLLAALGLSAFLPLFNLSWLYAKPSQVPADLTLLLPTWSGEIAPAADKSTYLDWVVLTYGVGVLLLAGRFILQMLSLWRIHAFSEQAILKGRVYRQVQEKVSPFSFGRCIYLNPHLHTEQELEALLLHEQAHVRQLHTLDVLVAQLGAILGWFNPVVWWLQRDIRQNLEFLADRQVLQQGVERKLYQYSLLQVVNQPQRSSLVLSFNFNHIKNRIMMMNKQESGSLQKLKYLLLSPALLALAFVATSTNADAETLHQGMSGQAQESTVTVGSVQQDSLVYFLDGKRTTAASIQRIDPATIDKMEVVKGEKARAAVSDANVKGVIYITTKKNWAAASGKTAQVTISEGETNKAVDNLPSNAVYLLNDKEATLADIKQLSPESIKSVSVVKDSEKLVQKYGPKAKNGVIMVYTK